MRLQLLNFLNNLRILLRKGDIHYNKFPNLMRCECIEKECQAELTLSKEASAP
jgi:hypothetical protein